MIFAAGLGTRLKPLTDHRPKALIIVAGKPMLEHVLLKLKAAGFDEIVINVHHFANQILAFLEGNDYFGLKIEISDETDELLDTGGGLKKASPLLLSNIRQLLRDISRTAIEKVDYTTESGKDILMESMTSLHNECYLLHNVDILSNCNLQELVKYHQQNLEAHATLLVSKRATSRYLLFNKDNRLCGWINKDTKEVKPAGLHYEEGKYKEYAYSGIQIISPFLFKDMPTGKHSIIDYYLSVCDKFHIQCYPVENLELIDIGKPETLAKAEEFIKRI